MCPFRAFSDPCEVPTARALLGQGLCIASLLYFIATVRARLPESHPIGAFQRTCISVLVASGTVFCHYGPYIIEYVMESFGAAALSSVESGSGTEPQEVGFSDSQPG